MEQHTNKATSNAYFQKSENRRFTPKYHLPKTNKKILRHHESAASNKFW